MQTLAFVEVEVMRPVSFTVLDLPFGAPVSSSRPLRGGVMLRLLACLWLNLVFGAFAAEVMPPKPQKHFNDYANVISPEVEQRLNRRLEDLERTNSTQVVVAIFQKMQSDSSIEDYTVRVAQNWGVGTKEKNNGAVLFVFAQDRKMFLQVGYGLEGALPDATAKDITEFRVKPHFRNNDYNAGIEAGVDGIIQAVGGEYQLTGPRGARGGGGRFGFVPFFLLLLMIVAIASTRRRRHRGWFYGGGGPIIWTGGGSGWSSGGGAGGWSGGFSGGGGSFGGGGAGSSW